MNAHRIVCGRSAITNRVLASVWAFTHTLENVNLAVETLFPITPVPYHQRFALQRDFVQQLEKQFVVRPDLQGLTLVHFSAELEPCLTHEHTLHTLNTP